MRKLLLVEMLARACKNLLRQALRDTLSNLREPSKYVLKEKIAAFLCLLSGANRLHSKAFWRDQVQLSMNEQADVGFRAQVLPAMDARFAANLPGAMTPAERQDLFGCIVDLESVGKLR